LAEVSEEGARLSALADTRLLDSAPELRFDRYTRLAAALLRAPVALITLLDEKRQWFKSCFGVDISETPREIAFCDHTIRSSNVMVIPDMTQDPRFAANPLVTGPPFVRFYAGAPLLMKGRNAIGTICVVDDKPRDGLSDTEVAALIDLAEMVVAEIEKAETSRARELALTELKHRMGNMFGQVGGLISLSDSDTMSKQTFIRELHRRLMSLHEINRRLAEGDWSATEMSTVISDSLRALPPSARVAVSGEDEPFMLGASAAMTLSMVVSELLTNSLKHGALRSGAEGVGLSWQVADSVFTLRWEEGSDGVAHTKLPRTGFGSLLLQRIAPADLNATVTYTISDAGVLYELSAPIASLQ
jgi:two-component sensor histidine kinase